MISLFLFIIGIVVGCVATKIIVKNNIIGDLRIDRSDTVDGPFLFLELDKGLETFNNKKYIVMRVLDEDFNPRK